MVPGTKFCIKEYIKFQGATRHLPFRTFLSILFRVSCSFSSLLKKAAFCIQWVVLGLSLELFSPQCFCNFANLGVCWYAGLGDLLTRIELVGYLRIPINQRSLMLAFRIVDMGLVHFHALFSSKLYELLWETLVEK